MFLLLAIINNPRGYDEHLGLQAISQTIDPLLAAYRDARLKGEPFETEAEIQRLATRAKRRGWLWMDRFETEVHLDFF